jgi:hypothetical protein
MEQRIAKWICLHACSFVLFDTKARATVIGFEREEDADAFRLEFVSSSNLCARPRELNRMAVRFISTPSIARLSIDIVYFAFTIVPSRTSRS